MYDYTHGKEVILNGSTYARGHYSDARRLQISHINYRETLTRRRDNIQGNKMLLVQQVKPVRVADRHVVTTGRRGGSVQHENHIDLTLVSKLVFFSSHIFQSESVAGWLTYSGVQVSSVICARFGNKYPLHNLVNDSIIFVSIIVSEEILGTEFFVGRKKITFISGK